MQKSHTQFFTSLKHLEKRLKLENNQALPPPPPPVNPQEETDSLGTPIYLCNQSAIEESEEAPPPQEFVSPPTKSNHGEADERVDVELLVQLLRLSDADAGSNEVGCDDEFYERIVGVKGPKNVKELERLERWIKHFSDKEPFRLAHLLLGKAAFVHSDDGLVFPSTIHDFLQNEPPTPTPNPTD